MGCLFLLSLGSSLGLLQHYRDPDRFPLLRHFRPDNLGLRAVSLEQARSTVGRAVFVDARDPAGYQQGHIPGAISIPASAGELERYPAALEGAPAIIVYCEEASCGAAAQVALRLSRRGYKQVHLMPEGWQGWTARDYPTEGPP